MFGARFSVWGARSADEANANVRCKVYRLGRPLGGRGECKCSVQGLAFGAPARRTRRTQMFGARFSVQGARSADEANANVRCNV